MTTHSCDCVYIFSRYKNGLMASCLWLELQSIWYAIVSNWLVLNLLLLLSAVAMTRWCSITMASLPAYPTWLPWQPNPCRSATVSLWVAVWYSSNCNWQLVWLACFENVWKNPNCKIYCIFTCFAWICSNIWMYFLQYMNIVTRTTVTEMRKKTVRTQLDYCHNYKICYIH